MCNKKKKVWMHENIMARDMAQRAALPKTFIYKVSLIIYKKLAIFQAFLNFFAFQMPSPANSYTNTPA